MQEQNIGKPKQEKLPKNNHPWNKKAKELLLQTETELDEGGQTYRELVEQGEHLHVLNLMEWAMSQTPEPQWLTSLNRTYPTWMTAQAIQELKRMRPKAAMKYLLSVPWDDDPEVHVQPTVEEMNSVTTPLNGARLMIQNLVDHLIFLNGNPWESPERN